MNRKTNSVVRPVTRAVLAVSVLACAVFCGAAEEDSRWVHPPRRTAICVVRWVPITPDVVDDGTIAGCYGFDASRTRAIKLPLAHAARISWPARASG